MCVRAILVKQTKHVQLHANSKKKWHTYPARV